MLLRDSRPGLYVPRWVPISAMLVALIGLGLSTYLTIEHFNTSVGLACPATGGVDCVKVTTSEQSKVFGIPVAVLGLVFFVPALIANLPVLWRSGHPLIRYGRLGGMIVGIGFVLYLVYAELFEIDAICLWCTGVHILTFLLFVITLLGTSYAIPVEED
ncbi:MAG TPA: vitamin K epoxide reductase family protein [Mycobacteriales bacterium]|nr:vitamin K epoxide reductase family protein [Mycobacteriales bacterium]